MTEELRHSLGLKVRGHRTKGRAGRTVGVKKKSVLARQR